MRRKILIPMATAYILFTAFLLLGSEEKKGTIKIGDVGKGTIEIEESEGEPSDNSGEGNETVSDTSVAVEASTEAIEETISDDSVSENTGEKIFYDVPLYNDNRRNVMIRRAPNLNAKIIGKIRPGDTAIAMHVERDEREWTIVSYNGIKGYSNLPVMDVQWDKAVLSQYTDEDLTEKAE